MFDVHITADGTEMLICHMENSHLVNTIRMHCRKIQEARAALEQNPSGFAIYEALGVNPSGMSRAQAQSIIRDRHKKLPPYVMEATIRGLGVQRFLAEAYGRSTAIPLPAPVLPASRDDNWRPVEVVGDDGEEDEFDYNDDHPDCNNPDYYNEIF